MKSSSEWAQLLLWILYAASLPTAVDSADSLEVIERRIEKQPQFESTPKYLLLALGPEADSLVWIVEDGRKLYVDKNANGDLTDDGDPIMPSGLREWQREAGSEAKSWDFEYTIEEFAPRGTVTHRDFCLRRWNYGDATGDSYGLSLTIDGEVPMYAGWVPFWSPLPAKASIIHFGGPLTPRMLRYREFTIGSGSRRLSVAFVNAGLGDAAKSLLSIEAPAADIMPILHIRWPTSSQNSPLQTTHRLNQRCCYWEFYTTEFEVPAEAAVGTATVTIELPEGALPLPLTTSEIEVPVVAGPAHTSASK